MLCFFFQSHCSDKILQKYYRIEWSNSRFIYTFNYIYSHWNKYFYLFSWPKKAKCWITLNSLHYVKLPALFRFYMIKINAQYFELIFINEVINIVWSDGDMKVIIYMHNVHLFVLSVTIAILIIIPISGSICSMLNTNHAELEWRHC